MTADAPTSLEHLETSVSDPPAPSFPSDVGFPRPLVASILRELALTAAIPISRANSYDQCGTEFILLRSKDDPSTYRLSCTTCHDRLCPRCGAQRARDLALGLRDVLKNREWRFLTLTVAGPNPKLAPAIRHLYDSFRRLRALPIWKSKVSGGVAILELTFNPASLSWHPHLHVLVCGSFFPQPALSAAWFEATHDSRVVHITLVRSHRSIVRYLTDYLSKPIPPDVFADRDRIAELAQSLAGVRMLNAFGACHGHTRLADKPESAWHRIGTLTRLLQDEHSDPLFRATLRTIWSQSVTEQSAIDFVFEGGP